MPTQLCPQCGMYCYREQGITECAYCGFDPLMAAPEPYPEQLELPLENSP